MEFLLGNLNKYSKFLKHYILILVVLILIIKLNLKTDENEIKPNTHSVSLNMRD